jgi:hypothetical protein
VLQSIPLRGHASQGRKSSPLMLDCLLEKDSLTTASTGS